MNIADTLTKLMAEASLSEGEVARLSGLKQPTVHRIKSGKVTNPRSDAVEKLAKVFGITPAQLRGEVPNPISSAGTYALPSLVKMKELNALEIADFHQGKITLSDVKTTFETRWQAPSEAYAYKVNDRLNEPFFMKGDRLAIMPCSSIAPGELGLYLINGAPLAARSTPFGIELTGDNSEPPAGEALCVGRIISLLPVEFG